MVWHLAKKRALGIYAVSGSDLKHSSIAAKREGERKGGGRGSELPLVESINNGDDGLKAREREGGTGRNGRLKTRRTLVAVFYLFCGWI